MVIFNQQTFKISTQKLFNRTSDIYGTFTTERNFPTHHSGFIASSTTNQLQIDLTPTQAMYAWMENVPFSCHMK